MQKHNWNTLTPALMAALISAAAAAEVSGAAAPEYEIRSPGLALRLSADGLIVGLQAGAKQLDLNVLGQTLAEGCRTKGQVAAKVIEGGGMEFARTVVAANPMHQCRVLDRFTPTKDSIRWEIEVRSEGEPWTTPISYQMKWPAKEATRFWAPVTQDGPWADPLLLKPFAAGAWSLGGAGYPPAHSLCIPLASALEPANDTGVSLIVSPESTLLHLWVETKADGSFAIRHESHRLGRGRKATFVADLVAHEADWRGSLRWMAAHYPKFFDPPNPKVDEMAGCGAYSAYQGPLDVGKLKKMAFRCNWGSSFDWPYLGMYLPPMSTDDECWRTAGQESSGKVDPARIKDMSFRKMNDYYRQMRADGFYVLCYFNCTEWGTNIRGPEAIKADLPEADWWKDANTFLFRKMPNAVYRGSDGKQEMSWGNSVVVDPGVPALREFLLEQARRHVEKLPDAAGIVIDRNDHIVRVNPNADDGVGWYGTTLPSTWMYPAVHSTPEKPGRLLSQSWKDLLPKLGAVMHSAGKVMYFNVFGHRIDVMQEADGIYNENGGHAWACNGSSLLGIRKPVMLWTIPIGAWPVTDAEPSNPDPFFQERLYLGAYPTIPFPGNDHAITPSPIIEREYLAYGPLLDAMRGKKWVLSPHCVEVKDGIAKCNLFEVFGGYAVPVTLAGQAKNARVILRGLKGISDTTTVEALHPGVEKPVKIDLQRQGTDFVMTVPLHRGCAMVRVVN